MTKKQYKGNTYIKVMPVSRIKTKTEVATIKLTPMCRRAWEAAATVETRSLSNMFEVAILDYCKRHRIPVPPAVDSADAAKAKESYTE